VLKFFESKQFLFLFYSNILAYNFITLGATGSDGPDSNAGYSGTGLQDVQVKNGKQEWIVPFTGRLSPGSLSILNSGSGAGIVEREDASVGKRHAQRSPVTKEGNHS